MKSGKNNQPGKLDQVGFTTLEVMETAYQYNLRLAQLIRPWLTGHILDIGAGTGNFIASLLSWNHTVTATDFNQEYVNILRKKYPQINVFQLDLQNHTLPQKYLSIFDSAIMLNVLEHISDSDQALKNIHRLLKPTGNLIIIVPAHQLAFGYIDQLLSHYRRYSQDALSIQLIHHNFKIIHIQYINSLLIFGWWLNGKIFHQRTIRPYQVKLANMLIPILTKIDTIFHPPFGLSVFCIAQKI